MLLLLPTLSYPSICLRTFACVHKSQQHELLPKTFLSSFSKNTFVASFHRSPVLCCMLRET